MSNKETYIINFQANVKGVDKVKKQFEDIMKLEGVSENLTEPMQKAWTQLQAKMTSYVNQMNEELAKENPDIAVLKTLDKELTTIIGRANSLNTAFQGLTLPKDITSQIDAIAKKINQANQEINRLQNANLEKQGSLHGGTKTGFKKGSAAENLAFTEAKVELPEIDEMQGKLGVVIDSWEDYKAALEAATKSGGQFAGQQKQVREHIKAVEEVLKTKSDAIKNEIDTNKQQIDSHKENIGNLETERIRLIETANASEELTEAQKALNNATQNNAKNITNLNTQQTKTKDSLIEQTKATNSAAESTNKFNLEQDKAKRSTDSFGGTVGKAAKQVITYGTIISLLKKAYSATINTITEMDKALTDMTVVTTLSREQAWELTVKFDELAAQTGKTSTEIANITTKFLQQGKSITQALQLTEAAAKAATIAGISGEKSVDLLTNAMNGFQLSANQAMEVSDKFAALAAASATDYEELATALSKVAAQANLAGMSMDFTLGLLAKGIETTREAPETIGTALKTVVSRMRELTDYGKTLEEGTDVNRVAAALGNVGIELMDANGQFRDLEDVLTDVGTKWNTLNKNQQANIAVAMAGTRQQSRFIAMMQDFDRTQQLVNISLESYGATLAQQTKYMGGLEASVVTLQNAWQSLIRGIVESDFIIGVIDFITSIVSGIDFILENTNLLIPLISVIGIMLLSQLSTKMAEHNIDKQRYQIQLEEIKKQDEEILQQKEQAQLKAKAILDAKKEQKIEAKNLLLKTKQTLQAKKQNRQNEIERLMKEEGLTLEQAQAKTSAITAKEEQDVAAAKALYNESSIEYQQALQDYNKANLEFQQAQIKCQQDQINSLGLMGGMMNAILLPLRAIQTVMTTINGLQQIWNALTAIGIKLKQKKAQKSLTAAGAAQTEAAAETEVAGATMAGSAGKIPYVGWIIGATILTALGVAALATVIKMKSLQSSTEESDEAMNQLQADLYNNTQSQKNIEELRDEFNDLTNSIIQTTDEAARLKEIIQELRDAGVNINEEMSLEQQKASINLHLAKLQIEEEDIVRDITNTRNKAWKNFNINDWSEDNPYFNKAKADNAKNNTANGWKIAAAALLPFGGLIGAADYHKDKDTTWLDHLADFLTLGLHGTIRNAVEEADGQTDETLNSNWYQEAKRQEFIKYIQGSQAQQNAIRTESYYAVSGIDEYGSTLQTIIQDTLIDNLSTYFGTDGTIDYEQFSADIDSTELHTLNDVLESGSWVEITEAISGMNNTLLINSSPLLKTLKELGPDKVKILDELGISLEQLNNIEKGLGTDGLKTFLNELNNIDKNTTKTEKNIFLVNKLLEANQKKNQKRRQEYQDYINNEMTEEKLRQKQQSGEELSEYEQLQLDKYNAKKQYDEEKAEYDEWYAEHGAEASEEELEQRRNNLAQYQAAYTGTLDTIAAYEEDAKTGLIDINYLKETIGLLSDYQDSLELKDNIASLSSAIEEFTSIIDLQNLSLEKTIELLQQYPAFTSFIEKGYITTNELSATMKAQAKEAVAKAKSTLEYADNYVKQIGSVYSGFDSLDSSYFITDLTLNNEQGEKARAAFTSMTEAEVSTWIKNYAKAAEITENDATAAYNTLLGFVTDFVGNNTLIKQYEDKGWGAVLDEAIWENFNAHKDSSIWQKINDGYLEQLDTINPDSQTYDKVFTNYVDGIATQLSLSSQEAEKSFEDFYKSIDNDRIKDAVQFINGELVFDSEKIENLTEDEKATVAALTTKWESYLEIVVNAKESAIEALNNLFQLYADQKSYQTEKEIEETENLISQLEERKEAYEEYYDELDALAEEEDRQQDRDSLIKQIQNLTGGADAASKQRIKELQQQLNELNEEDLQAQKENQRNALIQNIDTQIETLDNNINILNETLDEVDEDLKLIHNLLMSNADVDYNDADSIKTNLDSMFNKFGLSQDVITKILPGIISSIKLNNNDFSKETAYKLGELYGITEDQLKNIFGFSEGGIVDYTGPAMVHGSKTRPEAFLDAQDTANIARLIEILDQHRNITIPNLDAVTENSTVVTTIENITIQPQELNNNQDWQSAGQMLAAEFAQIIQQRGINVNVKK